MDNDFYYTLDEVIADKQTEANDIAEAKMNDATLDAINELERLAEEMESLPISVYRGCQWTGPNNYVSSVIFKVVKLLKE